MCSLKHTQDTIMSLNIITNTKIDNIIVLQFNKLTQEDDGCIHSKQLAR